MRCRIWWQRGAAREVNGSEAGAACEDDGGQLFAVLECGAIYGSEAGAAREVDGGQCPAIVECTAADGGEHSVAREVYGGEVVAAPEGVLSYLHGSGQGDVLQVVFLLEVFDADVGGVGEGDGEALVILSLPSFIVVI